MSDRKQTTIGGVWLRTFQSRIQVLVERDGKWHLVINEFCEGPISHIAEPGAIDAAAIDEVAHGK